MTGSLFKAFEETHYIVHHQQPFTLRIGQSSPDLDALLQATGRDCAAFITAWNPMSQQLSQNENQRRQKNMLNELNARNLSIVCGIGQHPTNGWPGEESILVLGLELDAARTVAKAFGQIAFVWASKGALVQLVET